MAIETFNTRRRDAEELHERLTRRSWLRRAVATAGTGLLLPQFAWSAEETAATAWGAKLKVHTVSPPNAETPIDQLFRNWITPVEEFYVRSHAPTNPEIDLAAYRLVIDGEVERPLSLTLAELTEKFPAAEVTATLCCAGNRREELSKIKPISGVQWGTGAIGNAKWGGIRLAEVLRHAGLKESARHVSFEGQDRHDVQGASTLFGGSIPLERAIVDDPLSAVLVATSMNGAPLTADHGAPARSLVPGFIGARSVKWLSHIHVSDRPSQNHYVQHAYKVVAEDTPAAWEGAPILYELPLNSVVGTAKMATMKKRQQLEVKGYALPSGHAGRTLRRVEVSADGGQTWTAAALQGKAQPYCWQFWSATVRQRKTPDSVLVRAIDSTWQMQPERGEWNVKGYMHNGWHSAQVSEG